MKNKSNILSIMLIVLLLSTSLYGCTNNNNEDTNVLESELDLKEDRISELEDEVEDLTAKNEALNQQLSDYQKLIDSEQTDSILSEAIIVMNLLKSKDMVNLAPHIHPTKGVRFSPYTHISEQDDLGFSSQEIETLSLLQSSQIYTWGVYDGSGEPIEETFNNYYDRFVYDVDFANPHVIGNNRGIGTGNTMSNIDDVYPDGVFIEFHFYGFDPQYTGMDWKSLKLVFEEYNGVWYLVSIIHDEWTI